MIVVMMIHDHRRHCNVEDKGQSSKTQFFLLHKNESFTFIEQLNYVFSMDMKMFFIVPLHT